MRGKGENGLRAGVKLFNLALRRAPVSILGVSIITFFIEHSPISTDIDANSVFGHKRRKTLALIGSGIELEPFEDVAAGATDYSTYFNTVNAA